MLAYKNFFLPGYSIRKDMFVYKNFFSERDQPQTKKLMLQNYNKSRLTLSFRKFDGRYNDLICDYKLPMAHILNDRLPTLSDCLFHTDSDG
jgi:hypothetical protein